MPRRGARVQRSQVALTRWECAPHPLDASAPRPARRSGWPGAGGSDCCSSPRSRRGVIRRLRGRLGLWLTRPLWPTAAFGRAATATSSQTTSTRPGARISAAPRCAGCSGTPCVPGSTGEPASSRRPRWRGCSSRTRGWPAVTASGSRCPRCCSGRRLSNPSPFGAGIVPGLKIARQPALAREIAYGHTFQLLPSVVSARVSSSPRAVVETLISGLGRSGALYTLGVINATAGAGTRSRPTPSTARPDRYAILVYDNNFPGQTRKVLVNTKTDTWSYRAAANPHAPASRYTGDATTQSLLLLPARPGLGVQPCPVLRAARASRRRAPLRGRPTRSAARRAVVCHCRRSGCRRPVRSAPIC